MADVPVSDRAEPWWVRTSYLTAAIIAAFGDWLFISAAPSSNPAWTAYLGTYLALAAIAAVVGGLAPPGGTRSACRGAATGVAAAFVLLGAASIGVLVIPLVGWLAISTFGGSRAMPWLAVTAMAISAAFVVAIAGLFVVYN